MNTRKRILAFFLAVVLTFSALPFSVSAEENNSVAGTVSDVSGQPPSLNGEEETGTGSGLEESGDEPQSEAEKALAAVEQAAMQTVDLPTVYVIDDFSDIKNRAEGGTEDMTKFGITREKVVSELEAHESDSYYLGTRYMGDDWQSPNGDTGYNGSAGMNCTGFVSYVLRKVGFKTACGFGSDRKEAPWAGETQLALYQGFPGGGGIEKIGS